MKYIQEYTHEWKAANIYHPLIWSKLISSQICYLVSDIVLKIIVTHRIVNRHMPNLFHLDLRLLWLNRLCVQACFYPIWKLQGPCTLYFLFLWQWNCISFHYHPYYEVYLNRDRRAVLNPISFSGSHQCLRQIFPMVSDL